MTNEQLEQWIDDLQSGMYINCVYCGHRYGPNSGPSTKKFNITMRKALEEHISSCPKHPLSAAKDEIATLKEQVKELEVTLDLIHDADMRAIKMWQEAHPDKENMWPDQAMMVCWLMEELDGERTHNRILKESQADWFEQMENRERKIEEQEKMIAAFMKEMDADQVESEILHGKIDALEADNQRLREALEKEVTFDDAPCEYDNSEAYAWANGYSTAIGAAREALKLAGKEGE